MNEFLAIITFLITEPHSGHESRFSTDYPTNCVAVSERISERLEAEGFLVDTFCDYTRAPAKSMRPRARPVRTDT